MACLAFAQTSNGTIAGSVTDATGAAITNAKVTATSLETGDTHTMQTNSVGAYRFESLLPGLYTVTVSAPSFATAKLQNVQIVASTVTAVNAVLKLGSASETVNVEATAETLQTESAEISHTITTAEVTKLPVLSLNAYALASTLPGVVTGVATSFTNGTQFAVNGTRPRANNFLIEGQDNNDSAIHGQGLQPGNLEAVKEVSVQTNSYAAEFGHGGGSVSNLIYKSGTNQFHGAAWNLHNNSALEANDHYNNIHGFPKEKYHENIFGFSFSGPIKNDKMFFFGSYQWDKYRSSTNGGTLYVPTANGVAALQSLLPTSTPQQAQQIKTLLQAIGDVRGVANVQRYALGGGRPSVEVGQIQRTGLPNNSESPELDLKGDYLITQNDTLSLRYVKTSGTWPLDTLNYPTQLPGFDTMQFGAAHNAGITYTHIFSPKLINELRISYGRIGFTFDFQPATYKNPLGLTATTSISGLTGWGAPGGDPQGRFHNTMQYQDSISWMTGNHSFKFGVDFADIRVRDQVPFNYYGSIGYASGGGYTALANYIDGFGGKSTTASITFGSPILRPQMLSQNYFIQDTWKLRTNFTLTYGFRYEYNGAPANNLKYPAMHEWLPNDPTYPSRIEQKADTKDFGPRLGIAYTPRFWQGLFGDNKTVIRAGFGMFYDGIFTNILDNSAAASPNAIAPSITSSLTASNPRGKPNWYWSTQSALLSPVLSPFAQQTTMADNLLSPQTIQWNLDIQRDMPGNFTLTTAYVGTRGVHLYGQNYLNPLNGAGVRVIPTRGPILARDNSGDSIYHGLDVKLDRRFSRRLLLRTAYTYSKNIDDVSEIFTTGNYSAYPLVQWPVPRGIYDRGPSALDRRQRLVFAYAYDIPKWKTSNRVLAVPAYIVNNWSISGTTAFQTGAPANIETGYDTNGDGITNDRPSLGNPNAPLASWGWQVPAGTPIMPGTTFTGYCDGPYWFNTNDNCHPVSLDSVHWFVPLNGIGNYGRNSWFVPGNQTWTFAMAKTINLHERHQLEFRTEMFNPFNHANTRVPNVTLATGSVVPTPGYKPLFLDYTNTIAGYRQIRMWLKYSF